MEIPVRITFRGVPSSPAIESDIREKAAKLGQFYDRITGCHVVVESPHRHHHQGKIFHIQVDLTLPGEEIIINRNPSEHHAHEDIHVAIRDAFDATKRRLQDYIRKRRMR
jgi:ribosome-associated translation inhibitor RaiA